MLKFANLSLSQKRFVVSVLESNPQYVKNPQITLKECAAIYYELRDQRSGAKNEKIGYPNWLFNKNKIQRGVYQLPVPTESELSAYQTELDSKLNPVNKAKAKVAKVQKAKTINVKSKVDAQSDSFEASRLQKIVDDYEPMEEFGADDFNQILRENGISV